MYGMINRAVESLVLTNYGPDAWRRIKERAGVDVDVFVSTEAYPDETTYRLVAAASEILDTPPADILEAFGVYWVLHTAEDGYGAILDAAGRSLPEFLMNLNQMHTRVAMIFPDLKPPRFECGEVTERSLLLHHFTDRPGLGPMVKGLVRGLAQRFETPVRVEQVRDRGEGADHDVFRVIWGAEAVA